jgi:hypothetical protein
VISGKEALIVLRVLRPIVLHVLRVLRLNSQHDETPRPGPNTLRIDLQ